MAGIKELLKSKEEKIVKESESENAYEEFKLPNEVVQVNFIVRQRGAITDEKHILYGGMMEGSKRIFPPKRSKNTFKYIKVLEKDEQKFLEEALGLPENGLNLYLNENNYWDSVSVELRKEGITLDLYDPMDYIKYKVLLTYGNTVAPSIGELKRQNKQTYMFVIVRSGEQDNIKVEAFNVRKEAYKIVDKVEVSIEKTKEFLYLMGVRVTSDTSISWIKSKLSDLVEENPEKVVEIYATKNYPIRSLIAKAVLSGIIKDSNGQYHLEDGVALCGPNENPSLSNAVRFLDDKLNADIRNRIEAKLG